MRTVWAEDEDGNLRPATKVDGDDIVIFTDDKPKPTAKPKKQKPEKG